MGLCVMMMCDGGMGPCAMAAYAHLPHALHHASLSFINVRSFISACRGLMDMALNVGELIYVGVCRTWVGGWREDGDEGAAGNRSVGQRVVRHEWCVRPQHSHTVRRGWKYAIQISESPAFCYYYCNNRQHTLLYILLCYFYCAVSDFLFIFIIIIMICCCVCVLHYMIHIVHCFL